MTPSTDATTTRGSLKVLLGAAPGVGKTFAMLNEGRRRAERGTDVVVGVVETHGRPHTVRQLEGLEILPRRQVEYRGATFTEMDIDAILARNPDVALVDELAHTNVPGSRNARRADDIEELLAAGIDVITTVNVQHLESLNDVVQRITGIQQQETVPDAVVRSASQIELVDMSPEALRSRMQHGNVYAPEKVASALANYFRPGNLAALRELALLWLADRVDAGITAYRKDNAISDIWPTRERIIVALSGGPEGEALLRRGARMANRGVGAELIAVYVAANDGLVRVDRPELVRQRALVEDLSGTFHTLTGDDAAEVILDYARSVNASSIVAGTTRSSKWQRLLRDPVDRRLVNGSGDIDVTLVSHQWQGSGVHRTREALSKKRRITAWILAIVAPFLLTFALTASEQHEAFALMAFLALTVGIALVGGIGAAIVSAVLGSLLVNWFFTPPLYTLTIHDPKSTIALVVFVLVGSAVAAVVDRAAARARAASIARTEADTLFLLTEQTLAEDLTAEGALSLLCETFHQTGVLLRERETLTSRWNTLAQSGVTDGEPDTLIALSDHLQFAFFGAPLTPVNERVMTAFGHQFQARKERDSLRDQARQVNELEARDSLQTALLAAVSHDLRTPLAAIKANASSLLATDVEWKAADRHDFAVMIDENADRLEHLIANLLDLTRLRTGHLEVHRHPVLAEEILSGALSETTNSTEIVVDIASDLPLITTDHGLAERLLANLIDNARRHQPAGRPVRIWSSYDQDSVTLAVTDNGPGIAQARYKDMFSPFKRLGDRAAETGLGLGLAVAAGFAQALDATITPSDTPGGGLTMSVTFPRRGVEP